MKYLTLISLPSTAVRVGLCVVLLTILSAFTAHAATYYVSSSDPNASDSYTTPTSTAPWKTIAKLNATTFSPGDFIYLKCGDTWREMLTISSSGNSTAPITFTSYGSGNKPNICGANLVTGWTAYTGGTANTYQATLAASTGIVTSDNAYIKKGSSATALTANQYYWSSGVLYINIGGDPTPHTVEAAQRDSAIYANHFNYITLSGLHAEKSNLATIHDNEGTFWTIQNCEMFFGNSSAAFGGGGLDTDGSDNLTVTGSHVNYALGDGMLIWESKNVTVSSNLVENVLDDGVNAGADGIQIGALTTEPTRCNNFQILNNIVSRPSASVEKGCIIAEMGDNGVISGNTCTNGKFGISLAGNNGTISYNSVTGTGTNGGIRISQDEALDGIQIYYNVVTNSFGFEGIWILNDMGHTTNRSNFLIANNVVYNTYYGIEIDQPFSGTIENNIAWDTGSNPKVRLNVSSVIAGQTLTVDHNIWQNSGTNPFIHVSGVSYTTLASWQATGQDAHSTTSSPLFVSGTDFHLQAGSPAIQAGASLGFTEDFVGIRFPLDLPPDIGIYEYQVTYAYEGFNYTGGTNLNAANGGTGWASSWAASGTGSALILSPGFTYTGLPATGNGFQIYDTGGSDEQVTRTLTKTFGQFQETYWISFLAKKLSTGREAYVNFGGLGFRAYQANAWDVKTPATSYTTITGATSSTLHLFVARVDAGATSDTVHVWLDPVISSGEPPVATALVTLTDTTGFNFNTLTIKHGPFGNSTQCGEYDEFRLGNSFQSVVTGP